MALGLSAIFWIAFFGSIYEYFQGAHRPDPFAEVEPIKSWQWWRYPLPDAAVAVIPWPAGAHGRFLPRGDYGQSHGVELTPGSATAALNGVGVVELADLQTFVDGSGWALDGNSQLYAKPTGGPWQRHEVQVSTETKGPPPEPTVSGRELFSLPSKLPIDWASFSPDGQFIVTLSSDDGLQGWRADTGDWVWQLSEKYGLPNDNPRFHSTNPWLVMPAVSHALVVDWRTGGLVSTLRSEKGNFSAAAFAPDGRVVTWSEAIGLSIWHVDGKRKGGLSLGEGPVEKFVFSPDGQLMITLLFGGGAVLYEFNSGKELWRYSGDDLRQIAFTNQGTALVLVKEPAGVEVVEFGSGQVQGSLPVARVIALDSRNDTLLFLEPKGQAFIWNYAGDKPLHFGGISATTAAVTPDGALFAVGREDGGVEFIERSGRQLADGLPGTGEALRMLAFGPGGGRLLTIGGDGFVTVWDASLVVPKRKPDTQLVRFDIPVTAMEFTNSGTGWLAAEDGTLLATQNRGQSWQRASFATGDSGQQQQKQQQNQETTSDRVPARPNALYFNDRLLGWIVGDDGFIAVTEDSGATWTIANSTTTRNLYAVHFANRSQGLAVGQGGTVLRSTDGGETWVSLENVTLEDLSSVLLQVDGVGWMTSATGVDLLAPVLQTTDGGATWQTIDYSELPAPWLLFLGIPLLALGGFIATYQRRDPIAEEGIDPAGSSDKPIGWDDPDPLKFQPIAKGLSYFLRNKKTEAPLTIGINGPWGTGKSSLMNLVMEDLRQYGCSPVWFNAWHHQKEEHLLAALLENIRKQAVPRIWHRDGILFRIRLLWLRTRNELKTLGALALFLAGLLVAFEVLVEGDGIGRLYRSALNGISDSLESDFAKQKAGPAQDIEDKAEKEESPVKAANGKAAATEAEDSKTGDAKVFDLTKSLAGLFDTALQKGGVLGTTAGVLAAFVWIMLRLRVLPSDPAKLMASLSRRLTVRDLRDQLGFRHNFGNEFKQVCKALKSDRSPGLVILIDDLDRCRPENVLEVLEAVNFLATAGDCFIILGLARRQVENCIAIGFKDFIVEGMEQEEIGLLKPGPAANGKAGNGQANGQTDSNPVRTMAAAYGSEANGANGIDHHATADERSFARRYLEKLINIEVAVPRGNPDQSAHLFASGHSANGLGQRLRRRQALYSGLGLAQLLVVGALVGMVASGLAPRLEPTSGSTVSKPQQAAPSQTDTSIGEVPRVATRTPEPGSTPSDPPSVATGTGVQRTETASAMPVPLLPVPSTALTSERPWWAWWGPSGLFVVIFALVAIRRRLRPLDTKVEDTEAFTNALQRWYPLIYSINPTPRAIKRFENRMRFLAMQARPPVQAPDLVDRTIDWLERMWSPVKGAWNQVKRAIVPKPKAEEDTSDADTSAEEDIEESADGKPDYEIDDDMLVALGTVEAVHRDTLKKRNTDQIRQLVVDKTKELESQLAPAKPNGGSKFRDQLADLKKYLEGDRPWKPETRDLTDYRRLSGQIRG